MGGLTKEFRPKMLATPCIFDERRSIAAQSATLSANGEHTTDPPQAGHIENNRAVKQTIPVQKGRFLLSGTKGAAPNVPATSGAALRFANSWRPQSYTLVTALPPASEPLPPSEEVGEVLEALALPAGMSLICDSVVSVGSDPTQRERATSRTPLERMAS